MQAETGVDISGVGMQEATMQCYPKRYLAHLGVGVGAVYWLYTVVIRMVYMEMDDTVSRIRVSMTVENS